MLTFRGFRRVLYFFALPVSRGLPLSSLCVPLLPFPKPAMADQVLLMLRLSGSLFQFPPSTFKDPCDYTGPTQIIQDNTAISRAADEQHQLHLRLLSALCHVSDTFTGPENMTGTCLGAFILPNTTTVIPSS